MAKPPNTSLDSGWSWVVCLASFLVQFLTLGIQNSFGTFFVEFLQEFGRGASSTAWIGSIAFGLTFMNGPLATALCARWGSRLVTCLGAALCVLGLLMTSYVKGFYWLYVTYGLVWGLGASLAYFGSIAALTSYFKRHLSLAYGICLSGSGAGTPVMILLLELLNTAFGWRTTFQSAAAICALIFLCGLTYLPSKSDQRPQEIPKITEAKLRSRTLCQRTAWSMRSVLRQFAGLFFDPVFWRDRAFVIWVAALGFVIFGYFIPFVFVIRIAKDLGVPDTQSTLLIAYLAITQTVFKIVFGKIGDIFRDKRIPILQATLLLQAIATTLCPLAARYGYPVLVAYVVTFGFCDGCWSVMVGMGTELIVGKAMMPRAFGNLYGVIAIPLILGPPVSGLIFDSLGRYDVAFFLSGGAIIVGICLMFVVQRLLSEGLRSRDAAHIAIDGTDEKESSVDQKHKLIVDYGGGLGLAGSRAASQLLIHRRSCLATDPPSRPCSLVISRLLEREIIEEEMSYGSSFGIHTAHEEDSLDFRRSCRNEELPDDIPAVVWSYLEEPPIKASVVFDCETELSIKNITAISDTDIHRINSLSTEQKLTKSDTMESVDSGRSTGSERLSEASERSGSYSEGIDCDYGKISTGAGSVYDKITTGADSVYDKISTEIESAHDKRPTGVESAHDKKSTEIDNAWSTSSDKNMNEKRNIINNTNKEDELQGTSDTMSYSWESSSTLSSIDSLIEDDITRGLPTCSYSPEEEAGVATDIFSRLMEKALEVSEVGSRQDLTVQGKEPGFSDSVGLDEHRLQLCLGLGASRETVL